MGIKKNVCNFLLILGVFLVVSYFISNYVILKRDKKKLYGVLPHSVEKDVNQSNEGPFKIIREKSGKEEEKDIAPNINDQNIFHFSTEDITDQVLDLLTNITCVQQFSCLDSVRQIDEEPCGHGAQVLCLEQ